MILLIWDWEHVIDPIQSCTDRSSEGIDNQDIQEDVVVAECDPDVGRLLLRALTTRTLKHMFLMLKVILLVFPQKQSLSSVWGL